MRRVPAADDFETIRIRLEELRQERALYAGGPVRGAAVPHPEVAAHQPAATERRPPLALRRQLRTQLWNAR
jgi:hypothetical protein